MLAKAGQETKKERSGRSGWQGGRSPDTQAVAVAVIAAVITVSLAQCLEKAPCRRDLLTTIKVDAPQIRVARQHKFQG